MKTLDSISFTQGERVLVRASLNVPYSDKGITDISRVESSLPTIRFLQEKGARVILIGHLSGSKSFSELSKTLQSILPHTFINSVTGQGVEKAICELLPGGVLLLENLRLEQGEESNDPKLASTLASYADKFVFDAFSDSHREHASIVGIARHIESVFGLGCQREIEHLASHQSSKNLIGIFGGGKLSTKVPLLLETMGKYEKIFTGGILANSILLKRGVKIGDSIIEEISEDKIIDNENIITPQDVVVSDKKGVTRVCAIEEIKSGDTILDLGPRSVSNIQKALESAHNVIWNGPLGWYERGCKDSTVLVAETLFKKSNARAVIGGGDTRSVLRGIPYDHKKIYFSLAGGAMLTFLTTGTTLGVEAIRKSPF